MLNTFDPNKPGEAIVLEYGELVLSACSLSDELDGESAKAALRISEGLEKEFVSFGSGAVSFGKAKQHLKVFRHMLGKLKKN